MSFKHHFKVDLKSDYYIDAVTYRGEEKIEATFYADTELDEQKALLFVLAWYIIGMDKKYGGLGRLTFNGYENVEFSIQECSTTQEYSNLTVDGQEWDSCDEGMDVDAVIQQIVSARNKKRNNELDFSEEELLEQVLRNADCYRADSCSFG